MLDTETGQLREVKYVKSPSVFQNPSCRLFGSRLRGRHRHRVGPLVRGRTRWWISATGVIFLVRVNVNVVAKYMADVRISVQRSEPSTEERRRVLSGMDDFAPFFS